MKGHVETSGLLHVQVRNRLKSTISQMKAGEKLPPERQLSEEFKVNRVTIRRAMADLESEGFVIRHQGRGTFVRNTTGVLHSENVKASLIGLVVPDVEMVHNAMIVKGAQEQARRDGFELLVCNSVLDTGRERGILERLMEYDLAGIIAYPFFTDVFDEAYETLLQRIVQEGKRLVLVDQYVPNLEIPVVQANKAHMGYIATQHLIMLGHRRIAYVSTGRFDPSGQANVAGYRQALEDYQIPFDEELSIEVPVQNSAGPVRELVKQKLQANPRAFTAMATPQFSMTYGIIKGLSDLGKTMPGDIAVVGSDVFNNPDYAYVTHTVQPFHEMGQEAVKLLLRLEDDSTLKRHVLLKSKLVIGTTCGART